MKKKVAYFAVFLIAFLITVYALYKTGSKKCGGKPDVAIYGPIVMADGIGRQAAEMAQIFGKKHKVKIFSRHINKTDLPSDILKMAKAKYKESAPIAIVHESLWSPGDSLDRFFPTVTSNDQIRYAYSMLESTRIIPEWVLMLNLYFDAVIVPDLFLVEVYKNSGVIIPIFHIPLGLDLENFLKMPLKTPKIKGPFVFACLASGIERKNHKTTIQAFAKAFGNDDNVCLHLNCRIAVPEVRNEIIAEIEKQKCKNIKYTEICLKKDAYLKFFSSIDCLLNLSKGEGFSIQPREAMALGIPVILTNNTGQSTICNSGLVRAVSSVIAEPRYYFGGELSVGEQFNCEVDDVAIAMKDVYLNYTKYINNAPLMRKWASAYDYKNLTPIYNSLITPQKVIFGDRNEITAEYLMTDSKVFYDKYTQLMKR